jgi:hypothetical protein
MKNVLLSISILFLFISASAQSGFITNRYYDDQYYIEDIPVGYPYRTYSFGQYNGTYQTWKRAEWHSSSGGHNVYVWNGYQWAYQWYNGYYYWFTWVTYQKYLGY